MKREGKVELVDFDTVKHIDKVYELMGMLHKEHALMFAKEGVNAIPPAFDPEEFIIDMIYYEKQLAGVVMSGSSGHFESMGIISNIILYPGWRNLGIGTRALKMIMDRMREDGAERVYLNVNAANTSAIAAYKKLGFKTQGLFMIAEINEGEE